MKENSPAEAAGLQTRDKILEIDGNPVPFWEDLQDIVHRSPGKVLQFKIQRESSLILNTSITPISEEISDLFGDRKKAGLIGISPLVRNITYVKEGSAADRAGLKLNDQLLSVDGVSILGWSDLRTSAVEKP